MDSPRIIFAGTPRFASPALERLVVSGQAPVAVLTQPDRPAGRGRRPRSGAVKELALRAGIPVLQQDSLRDERILEELARHAPDLLVTAAYGVLLPQAVLDLPHLGCWNLHASLLPRWRGASPIEHAILAGDTETGISLMEMDAGLDTGPVILARSLSIPERANAGELHDMLSGLAAKVLAEALVLLERGRLPSPRAQDEAAATRAPPIRKSDALLEWTRPADELDRMIRAYNPRPVAHGSICGLTVRVFKAEPAAGASGSGAAPGELVTSHGLRDRIRVACGRGVLDILELQAPGGRRMRARDWLNAHPDWR